MPSSQDGRTPGRVLGRVGLALFAAAVLSLAAITTLDIGAAADRKLLLNASFVFGTVLVLVGSVIRLRTPAGRDRRGWLLLAAARTDGSCARCAMPSGLGRAYLRTIVELGQILGMAVCAEGIETEAQRDVLSSLGCDLAQGWLFGRPVPAEDIVLGHPVVSR